MGKRCAKSLAPFRRFEWKSESGLSLPAFAELEPCLKCFGSSGLGEETSLCWSILVFLAFLFPPASCVLWQSLFQSLSHHPAAFLLGCPGWCSVSTTGVAEKQLRILAEILLFSPHLCLWHFGLGSPACGFLGTWVYVPAWLQRAAMWGVI